MYFLVCLVSQADYLKRGHHQGIYRHCPLIRCRLCLLADCPLCLLIFRPLSLLLPTSRVVPKGQLLPSFSLAGLLSWLPRLLIMLFLP